MARDWVRQVRGVDHHFRLMVLPWRPTIPAVLDRNIGPRSGMAAGISIAVGDTGLGMGAE